MTDYLDSLTDQGLNDLIAVEVLKWGQHPVSKDCWLDEDGYRMPKKLSIWSSSADAAIPLLEKYTPWIADKILRNPYRVQVWKGGIIDRGCYASATADSFARAACIAMIRAEWHRSLNKYATPPSQPAAPVETEKTTA